jgi:nucleotide-binding universal stress UspA family protein
VPESDARGGASIFGRIAVGVDGTDAGLDACRQAARLADEGAGVAAVNVVNLAQAVLVGPTAPRVANELRDEAEAALDEALEILGPGAGRRLLQGVPTRELIREVERGRVTLLALGSHGRTRAAEIMLGGTVGELLHAAPCSILVARKAEGPDHFPRQIVVGVDGSAGANAARGVAKDLATRFASSLRIVEEVEGHPVTALLEASRDADLLIVGSRGLHGLRSLGSVSERVAHQARSSVLVVRSDAPTSS